MSSLEVVNASVEVIDVLSIDENGEVTGWACAMNAIGLTKETIRDCPAPKGDCPRGFKATFECRKLGVD